jgi:ribonuclease P protein component
MLNTIRRLRRRSEFLRVARTRKRYAAPGLVLQVRRWTRDEGIGSEATVGLGFTVSKKVGNAVERNRARRRLKAVAAEVMPRCASTNTDYVVIGRRAALTRPFLDLLADLETALCRTGARQSECEAPR